MAVAVQVEANLHERRILVNKHAIKKKSGIYSHFTFLLALTTCEMLTFQFLPWKVAANVVGRYPRVPTPPPPPSAS